jgi:hypothetical protein
MWISLGVGSGSLSERDGIVGRSLRSLVWTFWLIGDERDSEGVRMSSLGQVYPGIENAWRGCFFHVVG